MSVTPFDPLNNGSPDRKVGCPPPTTGPETDTNPPHASMVSLDRVVVTSETRVAHFAQPGRLTDHSVTGEVGRVERSTG
jgi:hypothetical protein